MKTEKFSDKDMEGLSEEERAAITSEDDGSDAAPTTGDDEAGGDGEDPNFGASVANAPADPAVPADAGSKPATAIDSPAVAAEPAERDSNFTPTFAIDGPENFEASMEAMKGERAALTAKFKEGEISVEELLDGQAAVDARVNDLREHKFAADLTATLDERTKAQLWKNEQDDFMDANKQYVENKILRSALNAAVIDIASKEENSNRSGRWVLNEAHKAVQAAMGAKQADQTPNPTTVVDAGKKPAADRKPDLTLVPKTLANLPAADIQDTGGDEFSALDKLEGVELEQALAKLTPDQESRYLRGNG